MILISEISPSIASNNRKDIIMSAVPMSFENLTRSLPVGVLSKYEEGARIKESNKFAWSA